MQGIESLTTALVSTALDASSARQQVIAANIANAGRADYTAQRISFDATVSRLTAGQRMPASVDLHMHLRPDVGSDGIARAVQLDVEVGALAQNGVHYQALIKGLNKFMSVMASAVGDGKR